jgi:FlaA1/EpsC-like NDP-sugar epimerase
MLFDLLFISAAFSISLVLFKLTEIDNRYLSPYLPGLLLTLTSQIAIFLIFRIYRYRDKHHTLNPSSILHLLKTIGAAVFTSFISLTWYYGEWHSSLIIFYAFSFYLLSSLIIGQYTLSWFINYYNCKYRAETIPTLLYGANNQSIYVMNYLLSQEECCYRPVGYLDDDIELEGQYFNGYPVFGGHWRLEKLLNQHPVRSILITAEDLDAAILNRIQQITERRGILLAQIEYDSYGFCIRTLSPAESTLSHYQQIFNIRRN